MAKESKDKIAQTTVTAAEEQIFKLIVGVAKKDISMPVASQQLRDYVSSLSEEKQEEFRANARKWGLWIQSISEAFLQELTVIGAGQ